jgi:tetratricopeptide (TPR) repeat protein
MKDELRAGLACALLVALAAGCSTPFEGYRQEERGADERLAELVARMDDQEARGGAPGPEHDLADSGRLLNELRRLNQDHPTHVPTLFVLATKTQEAGQRERADAHLDQLFELAPAHPEAGVLRARLALRDGNLSAARRVLEQQIRYTPDHPGLREALGSVLYFAGELEPARRELERARRLGAPTWRVAFNLGLIEEADGNMTLAMERYQVASRLNADFRPAASRLAGLEAEFREVVR